MCVRASVYATLTTLRFWSVLLFFLNNQKVGVILKIKADYLNYIDNVEKSVVELATGVELTITPTKTDVLINGESVSEYKLEFSLEDTVNPYTLDYAFTKSELKQYITLLQNLQIQLKNEESKNAVSKSGGCR